MWSRRFVWRCWLWVVLFPAMAQGNDLLRGTVESLREADAPVLEDQPLWSGAVLAEFYWSRGYEPAWTRPATLQALSDAIEASAADGLDPADFYPKTVAALGQPGALERLGPRERLAADIRLSDALLRYIHHIRFGRVDPIAVNHGWNHRSPVPVETLVRDMDAVLDAADPAAQLADLTPKPFFYERLKRALSEYGDARLKDLPQIPAGRRIGLGARDPRVPLIRERLEILGDHKDPPPAEPERFDDALRASLMAFQSRMGLTPDGLASPATVAALNRPYDPAKAEAIRINLERMRWLYDSLPEDYVLVDVAGFMVHVVRGGKVEWSTRVVVGTPEQQTPSFRDEMEHVVFNPTWTVPPSIQKKMRGPGKFKMVDRRTGRAVSGGNASDWRRYSLVQAAGPKNALGRVKFIFPNNQSVYLHDTPSKGLFGQSVRAYSHGCVRVQNPVKLAEVILNKPEWDQPQINRVISTERTRYVFLDQHLPVLLYYLTASADENGRVSFRRDIYGRDADLRQAFRGEQSKARVAFGKPQPVVLPDPEALPTTAQSATAAGPDGPAQPVAAAAVAPESVVVPEPARPAESATPLDAPAPVHPSRSPAPARPVPDYPSPASAPMPRVEAGSMPAAEPRATLSQGARAQGAAPELALPVLSPPGAPKAPMEREAAARL